ncbi:MAG: TetR/AcrR family transcriptional regulator [Bacteroidetes bacterium]|nr:TetR/AcrR family transcriptional regulator [Bacteroidota bacterium]
MARLSIFVAETHTIMDRKERLLKAVLKYTHKQGLHNLAMGRLSKETKVATGTWYHHFQNREDLLEQVYLYCRHNLAQSFRMNPDTEKSVKNQLQTAIQTAWEHVCKNPEELRFIVEMEAGSHTSSAAMRESILYFEGLHRLCEKGTHEGILRTMPAHEMVLYIQHMIYSALRTAMNKSAKPAAESGPVLSEMIWQALKARR